MPTYPRSYLYVPGDQEGKLVRALERGADAIIVDLEDGVAASVRDLLAGCWRSVMTTQATGEPVGVC